MSEHQFRNTMFGGFNRQDVLDYLTSAAEKNNQEMARQRENSELLEQDLAATQATRTLTVQLPDRKLVFDPEMVQYLEIEGDPIQKSRNTLRDFILTRRPDAVIADDAPSLLCLQKAVYNTGIKIPEDIVLCGCNNDPLFELFSPPVILIIC